MNKREGGSWVTVPEYAQTFGITNSRVYQKIQFGKLESMTLKELAEKDWDAYCKIGRFSNCCVVVWLDDDDDGKGVVRND